jgi:GH24 family phage-related lysozyme (muramidase)
MVNLSRMKSQLVLHEGLKLLPYLDTEDNWTVLVGYNLTARGWDDIERTLGRAIAPPDATDAAPFGTPHLTEADALKVLEVDILRVQKAALIAFPEMVALNEVRQRVCLDMAFNMGLRALGFKQAIAAIKRKDWSKASRELYNSKWARQVGDGPGGKVDRCDRLASMLLTGNDYVV